MGWTYAISWLLTLYAKPAPKNMSTCETFLTKLQTIRDHCSQFNHPVLEHLFESRHLCFDLLGGFNYHSGVWCQRLWRGLVIAPSCENLCYRY